VISAQFFNNFLFFNFPKNEIYGDFLCEKSIARIAESLKRFTNSDSSGVKWSLLGGGGSPEKNIIFLKRGVNFTAWLFW
jgi:hypothetical protein